MKKGIIGNFRGLRAYATLLIFLSHCFMLSSYEHLYIFNYLGALGVTIFLMMSGFLNVYKYRDKNVSASTMLSKTLSKILPGHITALVATLPLLIGVISGEVIFNVISFVINTCLLHSFVPLRSIYFGYNSVSWFFSTYIFLIIMTPRMIKTFKKISKDKYIVYIVCLYVLQIIIFFLSGLSKYSYWIMYICPFTRMIEYMIGGLLAMMAMDFDLSKYVNSFFLCFLNVFLIVKIIACTFSQNDVFLTIAWTIPVSGLLISLYLNEDNNTVAHLFQNKAVLFINDYSMEILLFHHLIFRYCNFILYNLQLDTRISIVLALFTCIIISVMFKLIIQKLNKFRRREIDEGIDRNSGVL